MLDHLELHVLPPFEMPKIPVWQQGAPPPGAAPGASAPPLKVPENLKAYASYETYREKGHRSCIMTPTGRMSEESYEEEGTRRRDLVPVCLPSKRPRSIQSADSSIMCGGMNVAARHQHSPLSSTKSLDAGLNVTNEIYPEIKEEELKFGDETMAEACDLKARKYGS